LGRTGLLHGFPQGARAGSFLHGLLEWAGREGYDRVAADATELDELIAQRCAQNGDGAWTAALQRWMRAWLDTAWDLSALGGHGDAGQGGHAGPSGAAVWTVRPRELGRVQVELEFWLTWCSSMTAATSWPTTSPTGSATATPPTPPRR
jgi:exodeoxyribonuclease V beta subunit